MSDKLHDGTEPFRDRTCSRHNAPLPCTECALDESVRRAGERAQAQRANHFKRQTSPKARQLPRFVRTRR